MQCLVVTAKGLVTFRVSSRFLNFVGCFSIGIVETIVYSLLCCVVGIVECLFNLFSGTILSPIFWQQV